MSNRIKLPNGALGLKTLEKLELELKSRGVPTEIDVSDSSFEKQFSPNLAKMMVLYNCTYIGLSMEREEELESIIQTGWFLKENLGPKEFGAWLRNLIEQSDFPLMVLDNVVSNKTPKYQVVQPISFENDRLRFRKLKPTYTEPKVLEKALMSDVDIWVTDTIHHLDLANKNFGLRFACNMKERAILDIISNILSGRLKGFS